MQLFICNLRKFKFELASNCVRLGIQVRLDDGLYVLEGLVDD